jgi:hypothetical protein
MKVLLILAIGFVSSVSHAQQTTAFAGICHQGYEYKMKRDSFGKVAFVPTGRRCSSYRN